MIFALALVTIGLIVVTWKLAQTRLALQAMTTRLIHANEHVGKLTGQLLGHQGLVIHHHVDPAYDVPPAADREAIEAWLDQ